MKNRNLLVTISFGVVFFLLITYSLISFNNTVSAELEDSARSNLAETATQQQLALDRQLESMIYSLTSIAETLPIIGVDELGVLEYIHEKQEILNLETVLVIDNTGMAFLSTGVLDNVSQTDYFQAAYTGDQYATSPHISPYVNKEVVVVAVPIYLNTEDGTIIDGVLAVEYCTNYLDTLLTTFTDERGLNLVVDKNSEIILSTSSFDISFDAFANAEFEDGASFEGILEDFRAGNSGSISYTLAGERKFGEYRPMAINEWMLFFEISEQQVTESVRNISTSMIIVSALIILAAFIAIAYIVIAQSNASQALEKVAYYDELTGIPNLIKFKMLVSDVITKYPDKNYTMVKMDMVNFKAINEIFGYEEGNKVICAIADTGKTVPNDTFVQARVSAEEFMLFAESSLFENLHASSKSYENLFKTLLPQFAEHQFTFRYGRYFLSPGETDINDIVGKTNIAHSFAKHDSRINIWDYDEAFTRKVLRDTEIANKMHKALSNKEFKVFLQPKYDVVNSTIIGAEALVRWIEPDGNMIFPGEFIPLFEQNGFIVELDKYMLTRVCETLESWCAQGEQCIPVSVNFSRLHIQNPNFVKEISDLVSSYNIHPNCIEVELTETTIMENEHALKALLEQLRETGFLVSIDDFGSGYSSLGMLKNFKVDTLKLDRSFFIDISNDDESNRGNLVVESIVTLASNLGMRTVAEGIEEKYQTDFLKKIHCNAAQGYYYSKPLPVDEFEALFFKQP